jgi:acetyl esterase/lipase
MRTLMYSSESSQNGDLYLPLGPKSPVVCLLHGGFWKMPYGRDQLSSVAFDLASRGYAVWNIEYRRLGAPGGGWPGTLCDVALAIDYLATLAGEGIDLDLDRVIVAGHSAGGHLALWSATRHKPHGLFPRMRVLPLAAVGLAPICDLATAWECRIGGGIVSELLGGTPTEYPDRYAAASPIQLLPLGTKHAVIHGAKDEVVPIHQSRTYVDAAKASGDTVEFVELPHAGHMDFVDTLSEAHAAFCDWLKYQI